MAATAAAIQEGFTVHEKSLQEMCGMSKYEPLWNWIKENGTDSFKLNDGGVHLVPKRFCTYRTFWRNMICSRGSKRNSGESAGGEAVIQGEFGFMEAF